MANANEILNRIHSVQDTMKITNAMYMISSSKLKRARNALEKAEPHFYGSQVAITKILRHLPNIEHAFFGNLPEQQKSGIKRIGHLVITGDKGLAGAYNHNVIKLVMKQLKDENEHKLYVVGQIGRNYFAKKGIRISRHFAYTAQNPTIHRARNITDELISLYLDGELDEIHIVFTRMRTSMDFVAESHRLLPINKKEFSKYQVSKEDTEFLPSPADVMDSIIPNYLTGFVYGALVESYSSEQNARMQAMESSTNNAQEMLKELGILYNSARQAAITQEITEVISGAKAQKRKKAQK